MYRYNVIAIGEDRATLGSEPSASIAAYSRGRYLSWYRPLIAHICCCPQCGKSVFFTALAHKPTLEFTNFFGVEPNKKNDCFLEEAIMDGPGEYVCDETEGITRVEDLPKAKIKQRSRKRKKQMCPYCSYMAYRDKVFLRKLHDLGDLASNRPIDLLVAYSQHCCSKCKKYFNADLSDLADPGCHYTRRVVHLAVRLVVEDGLPYRPASWHLWRDHRVFVPWATIQNWVEATGKKS